MKVVHASFIGWFSRWNLPVSFGIWNFPVAAVDHVARSSVHGDMVTLAAQYLADSRCVGSGQKKSVSTQEIRRYPMKCSYHFFLWFAACFLPAISCRESWSTRRLSLLEHSIYNYWRTIHVYIYIYLIYIYICLCVYIYIHIIYIYIYLNRHHKPVYMYMDIHNVYIYTIVLPIIFYTVGLSSVVSLARDDEDPQAGQFFVQVCGAMWWQFNARKGWFAHKE